MSFLLTHWKWFALGALLLSLATFIHERDNRIRAEGEARVYLQLADSLERAAEAFKDSVATRDSIAEAQIAEAEERAMEAEVIIASIQENEERVESSTDETIALLREAVADSVETLVDSLEVEVLQEREAHERERAQFVELLDQKDVIIASLNQQVSDRDQRIASLEQALQARIQAGIAVERASTGFGEKILYAAGGFAVGLTVGVVSGAL